jgi:CubicO group peptidase (beta-lactamase class C family)
MKQAEIDKVFSAWDHPDTPGGAVAVIENGEVKHCKCYGLARLDTATPFKPSTKTRIASISKQFTTVCILLLREQGLLRLGDKVRDHVPELVIAGDTMTVRHLCQNASGLRDQLHLAILAGATYDDGFTKSLTGRLIKDQRSLNFRPGDQYRYSNANFVVLSWIIERLTQKPLGDVFREWIFDPLGMNRSELVETVTVRPEGAAVGYRSDGQDGFEPSPQACPLSGDGGIYSTLDDMIRWEKNFDQNIIGSETLLAGLRETTPLNHGTANFYALGLMLLDLNGERCEGHAGGLDGFKAFRMRFPDRRLSIITLSNRGDTSAIELSLGVTNIFLGGLSAAATNSVAGTPAHRNQANRYEDYAGFFQNTETGLGVEIAVDAGGMLLKLCGDEVRMEVHGVNDFRSGLDNAVWPMSLRLGTDPDSVYLRFGGGQAEAFFRAPAAEDGLDELAGAYCCAELDTTYRLGVRDGCLDLDIDGPGGSRSYPSLQRVARGSFLMDNQSEGQVVLWFRRDPLDRADRLLVSGARAQGLVFERREAGRGAQHANQ